MNVEVGVWVDVGVSVGRAITVSVRPEAYVATASVWTISTLIVGVDSTSPDPHALMNRTPTSKTTELVPTFLIFKRIPSLNRPSLLLAME